MTFLKLLAMTMFLHEEDVGGGAGGGGDAGVKDFGLPGSAAAPGPGGPKGTQAALATQAGGGAAPGFAGGAQVARDPNSAAHPFAQRVKNAGKPPQAAAPKEATVTAPADPDQAADDVTEADALEGATEEEIAQFVADFKYKVNGEELEIPEKYRGLVTDEASQNELRELFENAHGLPHVKQKLVNLAQEHQQYQQGYVQLATSVQEAMQFAKAGDFENLFERMKIPEQQVLQYFIDKANYNELPPEQRALHDRRRASEAQARDLQRQLQSEGSQNQARFDTMMQGMMDLALEKQEVKSFAEQFDKLPGQKAGAFRAAVIELGETMELRGESLLPMQAIQAVMQRWKPFMSQTQAAQAQSPKTASGAQVVVKRPAQIPTVGGGGGASPIKAGGVKSMADIARRKEQLARQAASVAGRG